MATVANTIKNTLRGYIPGDIHGPQSNLYNKNNDTLGQDMGYFGSLSERIDPHEINGKIYEDVSSIKGKDPIKLAEPLSEEEQVKLIQKQLEPKLWNGPTADIDKWRQQRENSLPKEEKPYNVTTKVGGTAEDIRISKPRI